MRFPEFREAGEWERKTLEKISTNISSGKDRDSTHGNYDLYGSTGIIGKTLKATYNGTYILVARVGANAGLLTKAKGKFGVTDNTLVIILNHKENIDYLYYLLEGIGLNKMVFGSGQPLITGGQLKNIKIYVPTPKEQQKIAATLSSLDDLITAQNEKLKALQAHKKGLMQQMFPAEGERVPRLRFGEFEGVEAWNKKILGDKSIAVFVSEKIPLQKFEIEDYISTENLLPDYSGVTTASKLPPLGSFTHFKKGDVLISNIRPYLKKVWHANKDGAASNDIIVIRATSSVTKTFLSFLLKNDCFINYVMKGAKGLKMPRGDKSLMEGYLIPFPEKDEQQKIVDCLTSLDDLIAAQTQKIAALKTHKKALMQQLFPNPNDTETT